MLNISTPLIVSPAKYCAHNRLIPRTFVIPEHHKTKPGLIHKCADLVREAYKLVKKYLKSFNFLNKRQKRSSRRETALVILEAMLHYVDVASLEVGKFISLGVIEPVVIQPSLKTQETFSLLSEINRDRPKSQHFSAKAISRALQDLKKAGYIEITERVVKNRHGEKRAIAAVKKLTFKFFNELGITASELQWAKERKIKKIARKHAIDKEIESIHHLVEFIKEEKQHNKSLETLVHEAEMEAKRSINYAVEIQKIIPDISSREITKYQIKRITKKKPPS